jgi:hypothetical protein
MKLEWEEFVGPQTEKAMGFGGAFLAYHKGEGSVLYLMRHGIPLCPINKERAERTFEGSPDEVRAKAQEWEDKIVASAHLIFGHIKE